MRHKELGTLTIALGMSLSVITAVEGAVYRVDDTAPGGQEADGSSWPLAFTNLQSALNLILEEDDEIWVAQGT